MISFQRRQDIIVYSKVNDVTSSRCSLNMLESACNHDVSFLMQLPSKCCFDFIHHSQISYGLCFLLAHLLGVNTGQTKRSLNNNQTPARSIKKKKNKEKKSQILTPKSTLSLDEFLLTSFQGSSKLSYRRL